MTEQEKQALIEWAHKWIEPARRTVENNPQDDSAKASLALYEIALASLTAPPVKLASGRLMQVAFETDPVNADMHLCISRDGAVAAIRAAGYEVDE